MKTVALLIISVTYGLFITVGLFAFGIPYLTLCLLFFGLISYVYQWAISKPYTNDEVKDYLAMSGMFTFGGIIAGYNLFQKGR